MQNQNKILIILALFLSSLVVYATQYNITYEGDRTLCVYNYLGNKTCIDKGEKYEYNSSQDYIFELNYQQLETTALGYFNFTYQIVFVFAFGIIVIFLLLTFIAFWI